MTTIGKKVEKWAEELSKVIDEPTQASWEKWYSHKSNKERWIEEHDRTE